MATDVNKAILIGNVVTEPVLKESKSGECIKFSLATSSNIFSSGNTKNKVSYIHKITVFNSSLKKIVKKFVQTGTKLYIEGIICPIEVCDENGLKYNKSYEILVKGMPESNIIALANIKKDD